MCLFTIVTGNFFVFILGNNQKAVRQNHYEVCFLLLLFFWHGNQRYLTFPYLNKMKSSCELYFQNLRFGATPSPSWYSSGGRRGFYSKDIREQAFCIPVKICPVQVLQVGSHSPSRLSGDIRDLQSWLLLGAWYAALITFLLMPH